MMRSTLVLGLVVMVLAGSQVPAEVDRSAEHARLLNGLDLTRRADLIEPDIAASLASDDGQDFRISQAISPARFSQDQGRIVNLSDGGWWSVWTDDRDGSTKIYRQRFDSTGAAQGGNEIIAGSLVGHDYADPRLALDTLGRVYFSWRDQTAGILFISRFSSSGTVDWSPLLINDTAGNSFAGPSDLAVFPDGQAVLVWEDYSLLGSTIQLKLLSSEGATLAGPIQVNSDGGSSSHWVPSVAVAPGSGFVICWEDYRNGQADIYARQYTGAGSSVGTDFAVVPSPDNTAAQYSPAITYSIQDRYIIGWTDLRQGQEIYLQRFSQITGLVGSGQQVSAGLDLVDNRDVSISTRLSGRTHVLWSASGADNAIQSLMLDSGLVPSGLPTRVNLSSLDQRWAPASRFAASGAYAVVWTESVDDNPDITLMLYTSAGARRLVDELIVNTDTRGAHASTPSIVASTDWWNVVTYVSRKNDRGDIYVRTVSHAGSFIEDEIKLNQDAGTSLQAEPSLAASPDRVMVVWNDTRTLGGFSGQRIFARRLRVHGVPVATEILISDSASLSTKSSPRVALHADGSGLVVWLDSRGGQAQGYGRIVNQAGTTVGSDFLISPQAQSNAVTRLYAGCDNSDRIGVIWFDGGAATPALHVQRFNADGSDAGSFVYAPTTPAEIEDVSADIGSDGRIAVFWTGYDNGDHYAYLTILNAAGAVLDGPVVVTDSEAADPMSPAVSICNNLHVSVTWLDRRDGRPLTYFQILDQSLTPLGANQAAASSTPEFMLSPATDAYRGRAWFVWVDPRTEGLNVYGQPYVYLPTDVDDDPVVLPTEFRLAQNYPNPFNPSTEIEYTLPRASRVQLTVFNVLGQVTRALVSRNESAGTYRVVWDGKGDDGAAVASGIYFYRLTASGYVETRKMMLLK